MHFVSSYRGFGLEDLSEAINKYDEVNFVGQENTGKSSIINALAESNTLESNFPGTTKDVIKIKFNNTIINDFPGYRNNTSYITKLNQHDLKLIDYKKEVNPKTYQLNQDQTIFLDSLLSVTFKNFDTKVGVTFYVPERIMLHRTKSSKEEEI
jgi:ribosome biogenesis GTPase A